MLTQFFGYCIVQYNIILIFLYFVYQTLFFLFNSLWHKELSCLHLFLIMYCTIQKLYYSIIFSSFFSLIPRFVLQFLLFLFLGRFFASPTVLPVLNCIVQYKNYTIV